MEYNTNKGGRPRKVKVELSDDGIKEVLQRVYVEAEDVRQKSLLLFNRVSKKMKDNTDFATLGKSSSEYLKIASGATNTKLAVAKQMHDHIIKSSKNDDDTVNGNEFVISDDIKEQLISLHQDVEKQMRQINKSDNIELKSKTNNDSE